MTNGRIFIFMKVQLLTFLINQDTLKVSKKGANMKIVRFMNSEKLAEMIGDGATCGDAEFLVDTLIEKFGFKDCYEISEEDFRALLPEKPIMQFNFDTQIEDIPEEFTLDELGIRLKLGDYHHDYDSDVDPKYSTTQILVDILIDGEVYYVALVAKCVEYPSKYIPEVDFDDQNEQTQTFRYKFTGDGDVEHPVFVEIRDAAIEIAQDWFDYLWRKEEEKEEEEDEDES